MYWKQTYWKAKSFETERDLGRSDFPFPNAAEYIEHAQLLAMDYPNMLTAVAVRNKKRTISFYFMTDVISTDGINIVLE